MTIPTLLIDGYGFVFRAYHVQPPLTSPDGRPVGAIYGMMSMLMKLLTDFKPVKCAMVFDSGGKNFRHEIYPEYKAHRPPVPEELKSQLPLVRDVASVLGFQILEIPNTEADDVIATVATRLSKAGEKVVIVSSDKDLMQLVGENIVMYDPLKAKYIDEAAVKEKFGVGPDKVRDALSLIGDSSDNIPGAPGIGPKGAADFISTFGGLKELLARAAEIKQYKKREIIQSNKERIMLSWELVGLKYDLDIDTNGAMHWNVPDRTRLANFITEFGFKSLITRAEKLFGVDLEVSSDPGVKPHENIQITSSDQLKKLLSAAIEKGIVAICLDTEHKLHLAVDEKQGYTIYLGESLGNSTSYAQSDMFSAPKNVLNLAELWDLFKNSSVKKITHDAKRLWHYVSRAVAHSDKYTSFEDLALMYYTLSAGLPQLSTHDFLEHNSITSFIAKYQESLAKIAQDKALSLYYDIDLPLSLVLYNMELAGVKIDQSMLAVMSKKFDLEIKELEQKIYKISGVEFNVASPKQLGEVLFEKMQLPSGKVSTKTKTYSTGAEVLDSLSEAGFEIADFVLRWREISKLKNTYTDALPRKIDPKTGRVHTNFVQNLTSTGRLSSVDPNLQNIPIRTEEGALIRKAFVANDGNKIMSADYSQIELRILAHVANVPHLREAFKNGEDIHKATAAQVFGVKLDSVTQELRRKAKAVNFGMIYGISAFGLGKQLGIERKEAADIQERYFKEYPGIKEYMEKIKVFAKENGYVANMFGRKCMLPMINDSNFSMRSFSERAAINAPLQGANADIIKLAMIAIDKKFRELNLKTKMILQVHDELVFEVPEHELEQVRCLVQKIMQNVVTLQVPLVVDIGVGSSWADCK